MPSKEERALLRFAEAMENADVPDLEALVREHPDLEDELRALHGALGWFDGVVGAAEGDAAELECGEAPARAPELPPRSGRSVRPRSTSG